MNNELIPFKAISSFIAALNEAFGTQHHPVKLYDRLLSKTTLSNDRIIKKHIEIFRLFCVNNRDCIVAKNKNLVEPVVTYSERVFVDMSVIFEKADSETSEIIWKHLLTISALLDPAGKAKDILKNSNTKEADFLSDIINKVESNIKPNANPLEAVSSIMQSGVFNDLLSSMNNGMQDGSLDLGKLMGTVQTMCSSLGNMNPGGAPNGAPGGAPDMMNMINTMVSNLNVGGADGGVPGAAPGGMPDMSALLPMLSGLTGVNTASPQVVPIEPEKETVVEEVD
jgi:hypothetical protein